MVLKRKDHPIKLKTCFSNCRVLKSSLFNSTFNYKKYEMI